MLLLFKLHLAVHKMYFLNEIICTRTDQQIKDMQSAWWKGKSMIDRIREFVPCSFERRRKCIHKIGFTIIQQ